MVSHARRSDWVQVGAMLAVLVAAGCTTGHAPENGRPPSVVVFLADDLGYGDFACYGNPINRTPHFDRLAAEGLRFTDCHSAGTVCSPSRASLLTGRHPYRMGFYYILGGGAHLSREELTIASMLRAEAGYDTCFVGKWHLTDLDRPERGQPSPAEHGFDHWFATTVNAFDGPRNPKKCRRNGEAVGEVEGWYCDVIVEEAKRWLEGRDDPAKPFFLLVCPHEPHTPLAPPEKYAELFTTDEVERLEDGIQYGGVPRPEEKEIEAEKKHYYGTIAQLDAAFGRLMEAIDDAGLREETLVFVTSDNGPEYPVNFPESRGAWDDPIRDHCFGTPGPLRGMKRFTYEGGHRVPGIVRWPGRVPAGEVSDALINGTDLLPTLCELAGVPVPSDRSIDGESVVAALLGRPFQRRRAVCWNQPVHECGFVPEMTLRDGDHALVAWFGEKAPEELWMDWIKTTRPERYELYDLTRDLGQRVNLAEVLPDDVQRLSAELERQWADIQAEAPVWERWKAK